MVVGLILKVDKLFGDELDFEDIKFAVKIKDIHKIEKKNSISISVFGYENKVKYQIYMSKKCFHVIHIDSLLIGEEQGKKHYVCIKVSNTFMYYHTLHRGRKQFCCYCLIALSTKKILKFHVKDCCDKK